MESLTEEEISIVRKFYRLYFDAIPKNKEDIWEFLDDLSSYDQEKHYNDEELEKTVSEIVDQYFNENGKIIKPYHYYTEGFVVDDNFIQERKDKTIKEIKCTRNRYRRKQDSPVFYHYIGADSCSDELGNFYYYVFNHYYDSIGASWQNR